MRRVLLAVICAGLLGLGGAAPTAQGAFDDPLFFFTSPDLDGPCGLAVNATGNFYVSDYYNRSVAVFAPPPSPYDKPPASGGQLLSASSAASNPHTGPADDPCGLALSATGTLYLNNYHRNVVRFPTPVSLTNANDKVIDSGDPSDPYANPTGVAVNPATSNVYVNDRTYVAEYSSSGVFIRRIGDGTLIDGYGIAVSGYSGTSGYLYVPDAATKTVKVYDPATDTTDPIASLSRPGGFGSLIDSAVAVDNSSGEVYAVDTIGPQFTERPQAVVYVFSAAGAYEGRLKHATINAAPTGLAVDNSGGSTQGRVYVTSGITDNASIYGYPAHAATGASAPPLAFGSSLADGGTAAGGSPASSSGSAASAAASGAVLAGSSASPSGTSPARAKSTARKHRRATRRRHTGHRRARGAHRAKRDRR